jgi:hypothetical protein
MRFLEKSIKGGNYMKRIQKIIAIAVILMVGLVSTALAVDDLKVTKFTVSPSSFKKGNNLSFSVEVENPTDSTVSGAGNILFDILDGTPERAGPGSFIGRTPIPTIAPHSKVTVALGQSYSVPSNADDLITFQIRLPSIVPGGEFGPVYRYKYIASCTYAPKPATLRTTPYKKFKK